MKHYKLVVLLLMIIVNFTYAQTSDSKVIKYILDTSSQMYNVRNMLETYSLIATNIKFKKPKERLQKDIKEYEALLNSLEKNFKNDKKIQNSVKLSFKAWKPVKKALLTALENSDRERMMKEGLFIHTNIRAVIKELAKIKKELLAKAKIKDTKFLNASIEIQASSQRLSAHYAMKMWGLPDPTIMKHWDNGVKIYTDSINLLKESKFYKNPKFKKLLDDSQSQLKYFKTVIKFNEKFVPSLVHQKAQIALKDAKEMTKMILEDTSK